jgi:Cd2+/Zn2+-exporting ATPase
LLTVSSHDHSHGNFTEHASLHAAIEQAEASGQTVMLVSKNSQVMGFVGVADISRPSSREALQSLKALNGGAKIVMLTGDHRAAAQGLAEDLGFVDEVFAGLMPADKLGVVGKLEKEYGPVVMIGDGVNDAPALAAASVGIAMGGAGTAQALETADIVLMQDDLTHLTAAIRISRRTRRIIWQNIIFSLVVKGVFLLLTVPGWATLWMAVFADMGASLLVIMNGMRLLGRSPINQRKAVT